MKNSGPIIKNVLFDLDGTLLPMDMGVFVEEYMRLLSDFGARRGMDPAKLIRGVWEGIGRMHVNDGARENDRVFWEAFTAVCPMSPGDREALDEFYLTDFQRVRKVCGFAPEAARAVGEIKAMGLRVALATNPVFPREATLSRVRWAGVDPLEFELITTYENSSFCKPDPRYFDEVCRRLRMAPEETLMVGNDTSDDTGGEALGMTVFLLTHSLIDRDGSGKSRPNGGFEELLSYIKYHAGKGE